MFYFWFQDQGQGLLDEVPEGQDVPPPPPPVQDAAAAAAAAPTTADLQAMIAQAVAQALGQQSSESESEDAGDEVLDEESLILGDPVNAALATTVRVRIKEKMTQENINAKIKKYLSIPSNMEKCLTGTRVNKELWQNLPLFAKNHDKK